MSYFVQTVNTKYALLIPSLVLLARASCIALFQLENQIRRSIRKARSRKRPCSLQLNELALFAFEEKYNNLALKEKGTKF